MSVFAQIDNTLVTAILQALAPPSALPPGRTFVDITAYPDKNLIGYTWDGVTFHPPNEAVQLPTGIDRVVSKLGA